MQESPPRFSANAWNELVRKVQRYRKVGGRNCKIRETHAGAVPIYTGRPRKRPWQITPFWNPDFPLTKNEQNATLRKSGSWCISVEPGFINGREPAMPMRAAALPTDAKVLGNKYGEDTDWLGKRDDFRSHLDVLLTDENRPFLPALLGSLQDRTAVFESGSGSRGAAYPDYFKFLGAREPEQVSPEDAFLAAIAGEEGGFGETPGPATLAALDFLGVNVTSGGRALPVDDSFLTQQVHLDDNFQYGDRLLYSTDVVLLVDRPAIKEVVEPNAFGVIRPAGYTLVSPDNQYHARIGLFSDVSELSLLRQQTILDRLQGSYEEPTFDFVKIGTVYLLSPEHPSLVHVELESDNSPGISETNITVLDGAWQAYVQHDVYWNLNFATRNILQKFTPDTDIESLVFGVLGVLGGGVGFLVGVSFANSIELMTDILTTGLNTSTDAGEFWTA